MRRQVRRMTACLLAAIMSIGMLSGLAQAEEVLPESSDYEAAVLVEQAGEVTAEEWAAEEPEEVPVAEEAPVEEAEAEEAQAEELAEEAEEEVPAEEPAAEEAEEPAAEMPEEPVEEEPAAEAQEDEAPAVEEAEEPEPEAEEPAVEEAEEPASEAEVPVVENTEEPAPEAEVPVAEDTEEPVVEAEELAEEPAEEMTEAAPAEEVLEEETVGALQEGNQEFFAYATASGEEKSSDYSFSVNANETATFQVTVEAEDTSDLHYEWYKTVILERVGNQVTSTDEQIENADTDTYVTEPITSYTGYYCRVADQYGNTAVVFFQVSVDNQFSAYAADSEDQTNWYSFMAERNETPTLRVAYEGIDTSQVTFEWMKAVEVEEIGSDGNPWTYMTDVVIDGANAETYVTEPITNGARYVCRVRDQYDNFCDVVFNISIDNHFCAYATASGEEKSSYYDYHIEPGDPLVMQVTVEADDTSELTYRWEKFYCIEVINNPDGSTTGTWTTIGLPDVTGDTCLIDAFNGMAEYRCQVSDQYGNSTEIVFNIEVDNQLTAYATDSGEDKSIWYAIDAAPNDPVTLRVTAEALDESELSYAWYKETWYQVEEPGQPVWETCDRELIEGESENTYSIEAGQIAPRYLCRVSDQYGNVQEVSFEIRIENELYAYATASSQQDSVYELAVPYNETAALEVSVDALDDADLTYKWYQKTITYESEEILNPIEQLERIFDCDTNIYNTDAVTEYSMYLCRVTDRYGNISDVNFTVLVDNGLFVYATDSAEMPSNMYTYEVEPGDTVTLGVTVEADDLSGLTYKWYKETEVEDIYSGGYYMTNVIIPEAQENTYTTGEIYDDERYTCVVTDKFGNTKDVNFTVYVNNSGDDPGDIPDDIPESMLNGENKLYAYVTGTAYEWAAYYYLVPGETVDLSVTAGAIDPEGITYQWYRKPLTLYQGNFANAYNPNPLVALEGETANEFSVIPDSSYLYQCDVQDAYGNTTNVKIYVIVQNQLQAEGVGAAYSEGNVYYYNVHPGDSLELQASVSALDPEDVTYTWGTVAAVNEYGYTYSGFEPIEGAEGDTFTTGELNEDIIYCCQIADKYGDHIEVNFSIAVIEPGPILVGENELYAYVTDTAYLDETFCYLAPGEEVNLSVTAGAIDTEGMTIQWGRRPISLHNGMFAFSYNPNPFEPLEGVTTNEYSVIPDSSYTYQCAVSDAYGNTKCVYFYVIVQNQLHLEGVDADNQTLVTYDYSVAPGTSRELKVSTTALDPEGIVYQWYKLSLVTDEDEFTYYERLPIEGATSDTYTTEALYEYVEYYCEAIDKYGDHYGIQLNVSVNNALQAYVTGTEHLKTVNVYAEPDEEVELSVTAEANDLEGITYQWSKRDFSLWGGHDLGVSSSDPFTEIPGATGSVFTEVPEHTASYECVVTDAYGNTAIVFFRVMIQNIQSIQAIGANISEGNKHYYSIEPGTSAELQVSVNALDMEGITYQWYESPVNEEMPIEGATTDSFTTGVLNEEKTYVCVVSDEKYGDRNYWITFIVQTHADNELFAYITGTEHLKTINVYVQPGEEVELSVTVEANDLEGITYQWCKSNFNLMYGNNPDIGSSVPYTEIVGATESVFTGVPDHTALYLCEVDDAYGNTSFVVFRVMIQNIQSVQAVGADSSEEYTYYYSVAPNTSAELQVSVNALDPEGITYQWFDDSEKIEGATTDSYTTSALNEDAVYRCIVSDQKYGDEYRIYFSIEISEAPHEHTYISEVTQPATCTDPGVRTYTCTGCEDSYTEVIPALGHDLQFVAEVAPTVQASGCKAHYQCSRCDKLFLDAEGKTETTTDELSISKLKTGWQKVDGQWYYYDATGKVCTGWTKVGKSWYYLGTDGAMTTGWQKVGKSWYYMNSSGVMQTDWQKIGGKWYYLGTNGVMRTKWQQIDEKWYYFGTDGKMVTGWKQISEKWYYFNSSGVMQTKWQQISGKWYYLGTDGVMCTGWQKISKKWYYLGTDGIMVTGWKKISSKWYYFNSSGVMMTGTQTIDGKSYTFDSSGVWTGK